MHSGEAFADLDKDGQDLGFRESFAKTTVHHVDNASSLAELHENKDLVHAIAHPMPCCVDKMNDVGMTFEYTLDWPNTHVNGDSGDREGELRTMMSTSFLTSVSMDSFGTAMRLRTWCVVPYTG